MRDPHRSLPAFERREIDALPVDFPAVDRQRWVDFVERWSTRAR